jgi:hypothetical protein
MTKKKLKNWDEANQAYLIAAIKVIREEVRFYLESLNNEDKKEPSDHPDLSLVQKELDQAAREMPSPAAIETLATLFHLSSFERKIILTCAGLELDSDFAAMISSLQGDPAQTLPTFSTVLAVFQDAHWSALSPNAPLRYWQLIEVNVSQLLTKSLLKIDERVLHYLTGVFQLDERLTGMVEPFIKESDLVPSFQEKADHIINVLTQSSVDAGLPVIEIIGDDMTDNLSISAEATSRLGLGLWTLSAFAVPANLKEVSELNRLWNREAVLGACALFLDCSETDNSESSRAQAITLFCENVKGVLFIGSRRWKPELRRSFITLDIQKPTAKEQFNLWKKHLGEKAMMLNEDLDHLTSQFNLSARAINTISSQLVRVDSHKKNNEEGSSAPFSNSLWKACCAYSRPRLNDLAQRIEPVAGWSDLILPDQQISTLREIAMHVKQRAKVYDEWGFGAVSSRGLGISVLFTGESGTGKTMASEVLAHELKLELFRIDLSQVVNKYIGETEKNLKKIFDAAEDGGVILLFDEADALFGKRSEVRDSHDRYANIEVSYLLQRMETYRGLAILTTNMKSALDKAFIRRLRFVVQFPFPDAKQRAEIWQRIFPANTPKEQLDIEKLARFNIAGGNIRNIALNAAFIAANEGKPVQMSHISIAARSEYAKLEKQMSTSEMIM